jgi:protein-tyrosine-phosphatase
VGRQAGLKKILFVCLANLCRSPMAKVIAEKFYGSFLQADSAGIAPGQGPLFPETTYVLREFYGVKLPNHKPRHVLEFPLADYDYIIALDSGVFVRLSEMKDIPKDKLYGWEVPDPCGEGLEAYERTARRLEEEMDRFVAKMEDK